MIYQNVLGPLGKEDNFTIVIIIIKITVKFGKIGSYETRLT